MDDLIRMWVSPAALGKLSVNWALKCHFLSKVRGYQGWLLRNFTPGKVFGGVSKCHEMQWLKTPVYWHGWERRTLVLSAIAGLYEKGAVEHINIPSAHHCCTLLICVMFSNLTYSHHVPPCQCYQTREWARGRRLIERGAWPRVWV